MTRYRFPVLAAALSVVLALGACTKSAGGDTSTTPSGPEVTIQGSAFDPAELTVAVGTTVAWTNRDAMSHTVTADAGAFDSGALGNGETFKWTFDQPGEFPYSCTIHPSMHGTITVTG
jgi:plastocyanin